MNNLRNIVNNSMKNQRKIIRKIMKKCMKFHQQIYETYMRNHQQINETAMKYHEKNNETCMNSMKKIWSENEKKAAGSPSGSTGPPIARAAQSNPKDFPSPDPETRKLNWGRKSKICTPLEREAVF